MTKFAHAFIDIIFKTVELVYHKPDPLGIFPDGQTIMYIMNQTMACPISSNYSKLVFFDKTCKTVLLIDVKFSMDINMVKASAEKYKKY